MTVGGGARPLPSSAVNALLEIIVERFPVVVYVVDAAGVCTYSAGKPLARVGLVPGQAVGTQVLDPDSDDHVAQGHLRRALAGHPTDYTWVSPDDQTRFETWLQPVVDAGGVVTAVVGAALDVTDAWRAEASEHARVLEQQDVLHQLMAVQDAERLRISAGLHDDTVQVLAAVALRVTTLRRREQGLDPSVQHDLSVMSRDLSAAGGRLRDLVAGLQPELLTRAGLAHALGELLGQAFGRDGTTTVDVRMPADGSEPDDAARRVLYEIAVEAVSNVRKHAGAATVRLGVDRSGTGWRLEVADDGCGTVQDVHGAAGGSGFGLRSMRQRAVAAGGSLELVSGPGVGTTVIARVPDVPPFLSAEGTAARPDVRGPLEHILENVSDAFVALDTSWRYVYVNRKAAELFGATPDELIGRTIWSRFPEGADSPFQDAYERAVREQRTVDVQDYFKPTDRWYSNRILPSPSGLTIFIEDITDQRRLELHRQDTEIASVVAHTWFVALAARTGCRHAVEGAVGSLVDAGLLRGLAVDVPGVRVSAGELTRDADVAPVLVGGRRAGEIRASWPEGATSWTAQLTVMLGQALAGRIAPGAGTEPEPEPEPVGGDGRADVGAGS